jgi:hypothetical protein
VSQTFALLDNVVPMFEQCFGPYRWGRIGYIATPKGSMEHTNNIALVADFVSSMTEPAQTTIAHELGHAWFGNLITCADDLMTAMRWEGLARQPQQLDLFPDLTKEEQAVVDVIRNQGEIHLNTLADVLHTPVYKLMSVLVELDCKKVIATLPGCRYTLA